MCAIYKIEFNFGARTLRKIRETICEITEMNGGLIYAKERSEYMSKYAKERSEYMSKYCK